MRTILLIGLLLAGFYGSVFAFAVWANQPLEQWTNNDVGLE